MLWNIGNKQKPEGKTKDTRIVELVRINDRIGLEHGGSSYLTRVEDVRPDSMDVALPIVNGEPVHVSAGSKLTINLFRHKGMQRIAATVKGITLDKVPLLTLSDFVDKGTIEQRNYERVKDMLSVQFRSEIGTGSTAPWISAHADDISGGGIHMVTSNVESLSAGGFIELELAIPGESTIKTLARVVRVGKARGQLNEHSVAVRFAQIRESDKARIVKRVRTRAEAIQAERRSVVRCRQNVPIKYRVRPASGEVLDWLNGAIEDVSTGGLKIAVGDASALRNGDRIEIWLKLPGGKDVKAECEAVWVRGSSEAGKNGVHVGARYSAITPLAQVAIAEFVANYHGDGTADWQKAA